jgi:two-component system response regulator FlrC
MQSREFREDLYFRISTFRLTLLPLAQRPGDILPLVAQMLVAHGQPDTPYNLSAEAQTLLVNYPWPGNVRELENVVQRAVVLCADGVITAAHLLFDEAQPLDFLAAAPSPIASEAESDASSMPALTDAFGPVTHASERVISAMSTAPVTKVEEPLAVDLQDAVKKSEHQMISAALQSTDSRLEAAKLLGISPRTLRYKMAQLRERGIHVSTSSASASA